MNTITGVLVAVRAGLPFSEDGRISITFNDETHDLLTRADGTDVTFNGDKLRGSDVVAAILDAENVNVEVILWLREGDASVKAKFTTEEA